MNPKRRAPLQASVAFALGLVASFVAWLSGAMNPEVPSEIQLG